MRRILRRQQKTGLEGCYIIIERARDLPALRFCDIIERRLKKFAVLVGKFFAWLRRVVLVDENCSQVRWALRKSFVRRQPNIDRQNDYLRLSHLFSLYFPNEFLNSSRPMMPNMCEPKLWPAAESKKAIRSRFCERNEQQKLPTNTV